MAIRPRPVTADFRRRAWHLLAPAGSAGGAAPWNPTQLPAFASSTKNVAYEYTTGKSVTGGFLDSWAPLAGSGGGSAVFTGTRRPLELVNGLLRWDTTDDTGVVAGAGGTTGNFAVWWCGVFPADTASRYLLSTILLSPLRGWMMFSAAGALRVSKFNAAAQEYSVNFAVSPGEKFSVLAFYTPTGIEVYFNEVLRTPSSTNGPGLPTDPIAAGDADLTLGNRTDFARPAGSDFAACGQYVGAISGADLTSMLSYLGTIRAVL